MKPMNLVFFLVLNIVPFSVDAQKDTSFVIGDTLYEYNYSKSGQLSSVFKYIRGRDYENYTNWTFFDKNGDTSSVFLEDKFKSLSLHYKKPGKSPDLKLYTIREHDQTVSYQYDEFGNLLGKSTRLQASNLEITQKYSNHVLISTDTSRLEKSKPKKVKKHELRNVDTIYVDYPELVMSDLGVVTIPGGRVIENAPYYIDSLVLVATRHARKIYYLKGNKPVYSPNARDGLYRRNHIPYQAGGRFRRVDTIVCILPSMDDLNNQYYSIHRQKLDSLGMVHYRDSMIRERTNFASKRYFLKESAGWEMIQGSKYRKGHIPTGVYYKYARCRFSEQKYLIIGSYDRKGRKNGMWKRYSYECDGKFYFKQYFKKGKLVWWSRDF